jgi:hypothetical protein
MMARGYLGKISAVVSVNTSDASRQLTASAREFKSYAQKIDGTISGAVRRAGKSFDELLTPLQKFQRALKQGVGQELKLVNQQQVQAFRQLVEAADRIAKPVAQAAKDFAGLSTQVQRNFLPALESAQKSAQQLLAEIDRGAKVSERDFANLESRINRVTQAQQRLKEASQATAGLASGQELRFQRPGFLQQTSRAAALQQQAAALSPEQIQGSGVAALVGQQRQAAQEAQNLLSTLERIRATRNGDAQAAEAAYNRQVASLRLVNDQLEREITLSQQAANAQREAAADAQRRAEAASRFLNVDQRESNLIANEGQQQDIRAYLQLLEQARARTEALTDAQRRAEAASRFLNVDQRESNLIANEGQQTDVRAYLQLLEDARIRTEALADAQRRAEAASRFLNVDQRGSDLLSNQGAASRVNPQQAFLDRVGGEITAVRNQLQELPDVAAELGPTVDNLTTRWQNLGRAGVGFTAAELQRVRTETQAIQAALESRRNIGEQFLQSFGGAGTAGLSLGIDERSLRAAGAQIEYVQGRLAGLSAQARGPVIAALEAFRQASLLTFSGAAEDAEQAAAAFEQARVALVEALSSATGTSQKKVADGLRRVGDVARGSFGNASLAIQQAAFAIEDFFSVTGGLDQSVRAAGNNISQLGFILGGTEGLILGISAAIGSQLVVALIKWANSGRGAEDTTKALNDALARQKNLVEELAQAFESLGDTIARRAFSPSAQDAREFGKQLDAIVKKQRELREERLLSLDEGVIGARADVNVAQNRLQKATNRDQAVAAQRQLDAARSRLAQEETRARNRPLVTPEGARSDALAILERLARSMPGPDEYGRNPQADAQALLDRTAASLGGVSDPREIIRVLRDAQSSAPDSMGGPRVVSELEAIIASLEEPARRATDEAIVITLNAANAAAQGLEEAQRQVSDAVKAGLPAALSLRAVLDRLGNEIDAAQQEIANANRDFEKDGDSDRRDRRVSTARGRIRAGRDARARAQEQATNLQERLILNPQSSLDARFQRISGVLSSSGNEDGIAARQLRELEARRARVQSQLDARPDSAFVRRRAEQELEAIRQATVPLESLAKSAAGAAAALDRLSNQLVDTVAQEARSSADQARRDANRALAEEAVDRPGADVDFAQRRRDRLSDEARRAEGEAQMVRDQNQRVREEFERQAAAGLIDDELKNLIKQRGEAQAVLDSETASVSEKNDAQRRRDEADRRIQRRFEDSPEGRDAARRANDADFRAQEARLMDESILRGRELLKTPAQRAMEEAGQQAFDLERAMDEGGVGQADRVAAFNRLAEQQMQQVAPMLAGFREERLNAMLQGPSRAALNVADAQTMEGNRELNRLLRGDDPNKDVNLVELQKQSELLQGVINAINEQAGADVVEIRG